MKVEREEIVFSYNDEDEAINHKNKMLQLGWQVRDIHPFLFKSIDCYLTVVA